LFADLSDASSTLFGVCDFTSNGFKFRTDAGSTNASGGTYIYMAFAEYPFKYSNARGSSYDKYTPPDTTYTIDQSLRFNDNDSAYLSRTPSASGNRRKWTWSGWVKKSSGNTSTGNQLFGYQRLNSSNRDSFAFSGSERLQYQLRVGGTVKCVGETDAVLRDASAWYHIVMSFDIDNATQNDRVKIYVNGEQKSITFSTAPVQSTDSFINSAVQHRMGVSTDASDYLDGYMADVYFIDGQALGPEHFGYKDATYGDWRPTTYRDGNPNPDYGSNGFHLKFESGFIGTDSSPMGNDWTASNLSGTNDVVLDTPTNNFCTMNPLGFTGSMSLSEGNLKGGGDNQNNVRAYSTFVIPSAGKWYCEFTEASAGYSGDFGLLDYDYIVANPTTISYSNAKTVYTGYYFIREAATLTSDGTTSVGDGSAGYGFSLQSVKGLAIDMDIGRAYFIPDSSGLTNSVYLDFDETKQWVIGGHRTASFITETFDFVLNAGQDSSFAGNKTAQGNTDSNGYGDFYYAPPSGFLALCTANLPDPAVVPGENFNTVLYTGDGTTNRSITGVGFQPDFVWGKERSASAHHTLVDAVRGLSSGGRLRSNTTDAEDNLSNATLASFDSDGFTTGSSTNIFNTNSATFVAWNWKADNTSGSSNTDGSITSTVAANADAGFSIVSYTGTGSAATVGHGLSSAPEMVIVKGRNVASTNWFIYTATQGATKYLDFSTGTGGTDSTSWNNTAPTSSVFSVGSSYYTNYSATTYIAYCFHSVDGFSKFGSYTGNGSADGTFVYTGFRPAFVMVKATGLTTDWTVMDSKRNPENAVDIILFANSSSAEPGLQDRIDILSNGFKARDTASGINNSGQTIIYMAFAENPFKRTNAR
jgi:hypothetical protein